MLSRIIYYKGYRIIENVSPDRYTMFVIGNGVKEDEVYYETSDSPEYGEEFATAAIDKYLNGYE